ncbi:MAG TPA: chorismate mutase [Gaiellaceae bacterium]|jgi:chorismate mutase|nr:chorismate mutase [Gaiellaceae bacterium]
MLEEIREEIAALDVRLLATINARLRKVAELHRWKAENGVDMVDPNREAWLVSYLQGVNRGPLSDEGVEELMQFVLDLVKREVASSAPK